MGKYDGLQKMDVRRKRTSGGKQGNLELSGMLFDHAGDGDDLGGGGAALVGAVEQAVVEADEVPAQVVGNVEGAVGTGLPLSDIYGVGLGDIAVVLKIGEGIMGEHLGIQAGEGDLRVHGVLPEQVIAPGQNQLGGFLGDQISLKVDLPAGKSEGIDGLDGEGADAEEGDGEEDGGDGQDSSFHGGHLHIRQGADKAFYNYIISERHCFA